VSDIASRFGAQLRQVRKSRSVSQEKLAELAGLHRTYVSSVERGERNVTIETIEKLALALDVSMQELVPESCDTVQHDE
jgi:transcriptional regulator with XRE-family HTH domain